MSPIPGPFSNLRGQGRVPVDVSVLHEAHAVKALSLIVFSHQKQALDAMGFI